MKKILCFVFVFFSLISLCSLNVFAAEEEVVETPEEEVVETVKVYTGVDEDLVMTLSLLTEETYSLHVKQGETEATLTGKYVVVEESIIDVYLGDTLFARFELDSENMTLTEIEFDEIETPIVYPCQVVIKESLNGSVIADIEEGNIGDVVTLKIQPMVFCKLVKVTVNGVDLLPNELGKYTFMLVEGENVISAEFVLDQENMKVVVDMINNAKLGNWEDIFSLNNLMNLISWGISLLMGSGFLLTLLKCKKIEAKTTEQVSAASQESAKGAINEYFETVIVPILEKQASKLESSNNAIYTMARCMTLAQENTEASRLAIVDELTKLVITDTNLATQVKTIIAEQVSQLKQVEEEKKISIEELEKENEKITDLGVNGRI